MTDCCLSKNVVFHSTPRYLFQSRYIHSTQVSEFMASVTKWNNRKFQYLFRLSLQEYYECKISFTRNRKTVSMSGISVSTISIHNPCNYCFMFFGAFCLYTFAYYCSYLMIFILCEYSHICFSYSGAAVYPPDIIMRNYLSHFQNLYIKFSIWHSSLRFTIHCKILILRL